MGLVLVALQLSYRHLPELQLAANFLEMGTNETLATWAACRENETIM